MEQAATPEQTNSRQIVRIVNYLDQHHLSVYFEDAVAMLIQAKDLQPKINVNKHFQDYFQLVVRGTHVLHRDFRFISATPYNRACFVHLLYKSLQGFLSNTDALKLKDYHALIELICFDFTKAFLLKMASTLDLKEGIESPLSTKEFLNAFQFFFFYQEFIEIVITIYDKGTKNAGHKQIVPLNGNYLMEGIQQSTQGTSISMPPLNCVKGHLLNADLPQSEFIQTLLNQHHQINTHIDKIRMSNTADAASSKYSTTEPLCAELLS